MRTIGLLGGMSWESTATYYRAINKGVKEKLGGLHSAKICMISVDFDEIEKLQHADDWDGAGDMLSRSAQAVEAGGADFLVICTNTMHKVADQIAQRIQIPILHIADATAEHLKAKGLERVGLLGTKFTMEQEFYVGRLRDQHGIQVLLPESEERSIIHGVIYEELCLGNTLDSSKRAFLDIIRKLHQRGAHGVILGCTEIAMLVQASDTDIPLFDTTAIHTQAAVERALS
ncbi:MAG: aspartate/glutamate racemase family protein [Verrucomicrobiota bacterium]